MPDTNADPNLLRNSLQKIHSQLQLTGEPPNELLLSFSAPLVDYVCALLRHAHKEGPRLSKTEWTQAIRILSDHSLLPLLYGLILQTSEGGKGVPSNVMEKMRRSFQASAIRSMNVERQLRSLSTALGQAGENYLILKGPAISGSLYPSPAMRPFNDIDLLVPTERFREVRRLIKDLGYRCEAERFERDRRLHCEETYRHPYENTYLPIELHWDIHHFYGVRGRAQIEELFSRAIQTPFEKLLLNGLNPVDALIHLALHMTLIHTREIRLIWLYDIHLLVKDICRRKMEEEIYQRAKEWSASLPLFHALQLTWAWIGSDPAGTFDLTPLLQNISPEHQRRWRKILNRSSDIRAMLSARLPTDLSPMKKVDALLRLAFPPVENIKKRYMVPNDYWLPLFYLRRFMERLILRNWKR